MRAWAIPVLASILILGTLGFSDSSPLFLQEAFAITTFSTPLQITNAATDGVNPGGPFLATSGNTVFIAWTSQDTATSTNNIKYKISTDGGSTFPFSGEAVSGRTLGISSLNIETSGTKFYVSWTERDTSSIPLYGLSSWRE